MSNQLHCPECGHLIGTLREPRSTPETKAFATLQSKRHVKAFLTNRARHVDDARIPSADLRAAYEQWCAENGHQPLTPQTFGRTLRALGAPPYRSSGKRYYLGIELVDPDNDQVETKTLDPIQVLVAGGYDPDEVADVVANFKPGEYLAELDRRRAGKPAGQDEGGGHASTPDRAAPPTVLRMTLDGGGGGFTEPVKFGSFSDAIAPGNEAGEQTYAERNVGASDALLPDGGLDLTPGSCQLADWCVLDADHEGDCSLIKPRDPDERPIPRTWFTDDATAEEQEAMDEYTASLGDPADQYTLTEGQLIRAHDVIGDIGDYEAPAEGDPADDQGAKQPGASWVRDDSEKWGHHVNPVDEDFPDSYPLGPEDEHGDDEGPGLTFSR